MATAHLAAGSWPWQVFHIGTFIDGAVGFVFLSGLVLGITQRRAIESGGVWAGERKLLRRICIIFCADIAICALALTTTVIDPTRRGTYPSVDDLNGPLPVALATLTLRFSPQYSSILSLYVVLMLLGVVAVGGLAKHRTVAERANSLGLDEPPAAVVGGGGHGGPSVLGWRMAVDPNPRGRPCSPGPLLMALSRPGRS